MTSSPAARASRRVALGGVFALGLALSLLLALRSQVGGDQLDLLARGWLLVARGEWVPFGNPSSSGGQVPGGATALLVAAPLALWWHHRAPVLAILLTQVVAFLLLDRWLREAVSPRARLLFAVLYWINPWRVLLSGFLWNPGFMFLVGSVHAWTSWRQRRAGSFGASLLHALVLGVGFQIHPAAVLLGATSVLLLATGHLRLRWGGVLAGTILAAVPLVPWVLAVQAHPAALPVSKGFPGRGLLLVFPLLRGVLYWLRHISFALPGPETRLDFRYGDAAAWDRPLRLLGKVVVDGVGALAVLLPLVANVRLWRPLWRRRPTGHRRAFLAHAWRLLRAGSDGRPWLVAYVRNSFVASLAIYSLAPTTIMWWQGVPLLHAAALAVVLWADALARLGRARRWARRVARGAWAWGAAAVALVLLMALGGRRFRCGGPDCIVIALRHDHPMFHDLQIAETCPIGVVPGGWWPDVLPESGPDGPQGRRAR